MIAGLDSSASRPTPEQAAAMFAAGVRVYGGYLPPGRGLFSPWDRESFQIVQAAGMRALGFCSGQDDPAGIAATAASWGVLACLDVEPGIREDGSWVQGWLDASGAGLYGLASVHSGRRAPFHVVAYYPGLDPGATWPPWELRPPGPCGWQWQGTHDEFGVSVDRSWFDDWFGLPAPDPAPPPALEMRMVEHFTLPDQTLATLELRLDGTISYTVTDPYNLAVLRRDNPLPGLWLTIERCGVYQEEVYVRGTGAGASAAGRLYQATLSLIPGSTWVLGPDPIA